MKTLHFWRIHDQELLINGLIIPISAGKSDEVHVFTQDRGNVIVLTINHALYYCGIEAFDKKGELFDHTFLQADNEISEVLGPMGLDLAPITIAKRLYNYLGDR